MRWTLESTTIEASLETPLLGALAVVRFARCLPLAEPLDTDTKPSITGRPIFIVNAVHVYHMLAFREQTGASFLRVFVTRV